jgi:Flp pilus assembly pilin Flp
MLWYGVTMMRGAMAHARELRRDERGATVLEWALIAAVIVVAASIIGAVVYNIVDTKSSQLEDCANMPAGSTCE